MRLAEESLVVACLSVLPLGGAWWLAEALESAAWRNTLRAALDGQWVRLVAWVAWLVGCLS